MARDEHAAVGPDLTHLDSVLKKHLEAIAREETPERLLTLAQEVQRLTLPKDV